MRKRHLLGIILSFFVISIAFADMDLSQHGPDLLKASFPIRFKFEQANHKPWQRATVEERRKFLVAWYKDEALAARKAREDAVQEERRKHEIATQVIAEKRRVDALNKSYEKEQQQEHMDTVLKKRAFDNAVASQVRELKQLQSSSPNAR